MRMEHNREIAGEKVGFKEKSNNQRSPKQRKRKLINRSPLGESRTSKKVKIWDSDDELVIEVPVVGDDINLSQEIPPLPQPDNNVLKGTSFEDNFNIIFGNVNGLSIDKLNRLNVLTKNDHLLCREAHQKKTMKQ